jgi:hypothetical protein
MARCPVLYMQDLFYLVASVVLSEFGYYTWLLIKRERSYNKEVEYDGATLMETVRQEWGDGAESG